MKKLRKKGGFTFVEMLCALLILVLASGAMITVISVSEKTYRQSVSASQSQILCSTLTTAVSDELRYADMIKLDDGGKWTFSGPTCPEGSYYDQNGEGYVTLGGQEVLGRTAYPGGVKASVELSYVDSTKLFAVTISVTSSSGEKLAQNEFGVKPLNT